MCRVASVRAVLQWGQDPIRRPDLVAPPAQRRYTGFDRIQVRSRPFARRSASARYTGSSTSASSAVPLGPCDLRAVAQQAQPRGQRRAHARVRRPAGASAPIGRSSASNGKPRAGATASTAM